MKAILVMDMPTKCSDCQFYYQTHDENDDYVSKCEVLSDMTIDGFVDKYSECPLRPMPSKIGMEEALKMPRNGCIADVISSYNACIDEILGDKERCFSEN